MADVRKEFHSASRAERAAGNSPGAAGHTAAPAPSADLSPLAAALSLGEFVKGEHGVSGLRRYLLSLNPLLPYDMIEQLAGKFDLSAPPKPPEPTIPQVEEKKAAPPGLSPEQLLMMMNALGGTSKGGIDPSMLMQLMKK